MDQTFYNPELYTLNLTGRGQNETYVGIHKQMPNITFIFKYHNKDNSPEVEILNYLQNKIPSEGHFPIVRYHRVGNNISLSGASYKELIVMDKIEGRVLDGDAKANDPHNINLKLEPLYNRKKVLMSLTNLISL